MLCKTLILFIWSCGNLSGPENWQAAGPNVLNVEKVFAKTCYFRLKGKHTMIPTIVAIQTACIDTTFLTFAGIPTQIRLIGLTKIFRFPTFCQQGSSNSGDNQITNVVRVHGMFAEVFNNGICLT